MKPRDFKENVIVDLLGREVVEVQRKAAWKDKVAVRVVTDSVVVETTLSYQNAEDLAKALLSSLEGLRHGEAA